MSKRGRKSKVAYVPKYEIMICRPHPSGIGSVYVKTVDIMERPSFDNCDFFDETNLKWARWEHGVKR